MKLFCYGCEKYFETANRSFYFKILELTFCSKRCYKFIWKIIKSKEENVGLIKIWPRESKTEILLD
ncbi:hypothetical protein [Mycoplasma phage sp.]|uniref:TRASH domain-containing protein n=1 Tax=Mycoplasmopsis anatis 1340 TaxID=1034808 RepID=F9QDK4_9BACT|nr:hypothetical protein [Mycoplasmopsis anatis]QRI43913.1 hypothetical protein [Mycoplasma phage sp.]AWX70397.1 hypothetical protein DP067_03510 [Mycoplasmopsis anatis]EGS29180.1 hypothetical protein GIG_02558 [Mycoplasmopsis anatis 1340]QRI43918.1 hypothetical protein [Mycoplasma phage sp.]QRI43953.1 hypothetical protein [Mycoplasma phage sp.]